MEQELSNAISLEKSLSGIETNDDNTRLDDSNPTGVDLDDAILKELESCLEGIKDDNATD